MGQALPVNLGQREAYVYLTRFVRALGKICSSFFFFFELCQYSFSTSLILQNIFDTQNLPWVWQQSFFFIRDYVVEL